MKKFLTNILGFATVLFLLNVALFQFAQSTYYKNYLKLPNSSVHNLMLADSHGYALGELPSRYGVYNYSDEGDSYIDLNRKLAYLIRGGFAIDTVYLSLDDHTLSPYRAKANNSGKSVQWTTVSDFENSYAYLKAKVLPYYLPFFQPNIGALLKKSIQHEVKNLGSSESKQNSWVNLSESDRKKSAEQRFRVYYTESTASTILQAELLDIISLCKDNDIELIGVKFPLSRTYISVMNGASFNADSFARNAGIPVLDFTEYAPDEAELFEDQDHLNPQGAERFVRSWFRDK